MLLSALLFPAISLLLLVNINRFLTLATFIRSLHDNYKENFNHVLLEQIENIQKRVHLIIHKLGVGIEQFIPERFVLLLLFSGQIRLGKHILSLIVLVLLISLILSLREIALSIDALERYSNDIEKTEK